MVARRGQRKYSDALESQTRGPVKTITGNGMVYYYNRDGGLEDMVLVESGRHIRFSGNRDELGWIVSLVTYTQKCPTTRWNIKKLEYDRNNRLYRKHSTQKGLMGGTTITYSYDNAGTCIGYQTDSKVSLFLGHKNQYEQIREDSHGNWIYRKSIQITSDGQKVPFKIEKRDIAYWDDEAEVRPEPLADESADDQASADMDTCAESWDLGIGKKLRLTAYSVIRNGKEGL